MGFAEATVLANNGLVTEPARDAYQKALKLAVGARAVVTRDAGLTGEVPPGLLELANAYLAVNDADWGERVRKKDAIATEMGTFALTNQVPKEALSLSDNEGVLLALAEATRWCEDVRAAVERHRFEREGQHVDVTVSIGVVELAADRATTDALVDAADARTARVVWADFGRRPSALVLPAGDPTVPLNSCYALPCRDPRDALAVAALLNSPLAAAWLNALAEPARGGGDRDPASGQSTGVRRRSRRGSDRLTK